MCCVSLGQWRVLLGTTFCMGMERPVDRTTRNHYRNYCHCNGQPRLGSTSKCTSLGSSVVSRDISAALWYMTAIPRDPKWLLWGQSQPVWSAPLCQPGTGSPLSSLRVIVHSFPLPTLQHSWMTEGSSTFTVP